jgi:hypothetical protein
MDLVKQKSVLKKNTDNHFLRILVSIISYEFLITGFGLFGFLILFSECWLFCGSILLLLPRIGTDWSTGFCSIFIFCA